jgi:hypothetical protein
MRELTKEERKQQGEGRPAALETPGHGLNQVPAEQRPKGWRLTGPVSALSEDALG